MVELPFRRELAASLRPQEQSRFWAVIPWCMLPLRTWKPTLNGPARNCQPKPNGNSRHVAVWTAPNSPGATISARRQTSRQYLAGQFPARKPLRQRTDRTSPVLAFPANGYGIYDMIGNVWEWTADWWSSKHEADAPKACCIPENPRGGAETASFDPCQPRIKIPRKVIKGGSHLCAPNYCRRYRPAARHAEAVDTSTSHVEFRCVIRTGSEKCPVKTTETSQA